MPFMTEKAKNAEKKSHYTTGGFGPTPAPIPTKGEPTAEKTVANDLRAGKNGK